MQLTGHIDYDKMRDRSTDLRVGETCVVCVWPFASGNRCVADAATSKSTNETNVCILGTPRIGQVSVSLAGTGRFQT